MKPISFIAYGDVGLQTGEDITELSIGLNRRDLLDQVYCRGVEEYQLPERLVTEPIPFGRTIPRMMTGINKFLTERFKNRYYSEQVFDIFTAKHISATGFHLHHTPGHIRTLREGNKAGNHTIVKATTEYSISYDQRLREEYKKLGVGITLSSIQQKRSELREQTLRECDQILAISSFVKESLVTSNFDPDKIYITPLGVKHGYYPTNPEESDGPFTALYVGSVTVAKGIPYLLEAWRQNDWGDDDQARLLLCGRVSSTMQRILSQYDFDNVKTPGYVDPREYHQKASVFVFPSISDGFGKAPLEAMAAGVPVITTDHTGMPDIMNDGKEGYIVSAGDPHTLANRLRQIRENPTVRQRMRRKAIETAKDQTWDKHAQAVVDAIGHAID